MAPIRVSKTVPRLNLKLSDALRLRRHFYSCQASSNIQTISDLAHCSLATDFILKPRLLDLHSLHPRLVFPAKWLHKRRLSFYSATDPHLRLALINISLQNLPNKLLLPVDCLHIVSARSNRALCICDLNIDQYFLAVSFGIFTEQTDLAVFPIILF